MSENYKILEDIETLNNKGRYNIYITTDKVFCISIDNYTSALRKLSKISGTLGGIGGVLGIVGILIVSVPIGIFVAPRYKKEKEIALDKMRNIDIHELEGLKGYSCMRLEIEFEKMKKERYRVHVGKDWLLLNDADAVNLQTILNLPIS